MKIAGITRIKNEGAIINETLNHFSKYCNRGIYVYDDCSTDNTVEICEKHPSVKGIIRGKEWDTDRTRAEYTTRQSILELAQKDNPDWICYFDADERLDCDWEYTQYMMRSPDFNAIFMKLFDAYITDDDIINNTNANIKNVRDIKLEYHNLYFNKKLFGIKPYNQRKWFGCEYREIGMFFKNTPILRYEKRDQRIATFSGHAIVNGYVKHYGKAISIQQWEETADYYIKHFPEPYKTKWKARKGKAIHTKSDFGNELITWDEREEKGVLLSK